MLVIGLSGEHEANQSTRRLGGLPQIDLVGTIGGQRPPDYGR